ncbi:MULTISPECIES: tyrosine-type recombinase/integrase [unclassified Butyrivibrio]|uniref:tyrosine-type recombinase/integrase n=1 Tax=unclassified Butyrivibrio TaxID=2639466 RepID=UPI0003B48943|nr:MULTISPECIES: tyrosine-type recombinase/integrase [unclassified Butyrivibrio]SDB28396.1 Site-specific recombinase XerD [Butyrivibrio sp. INlla16]SEL05537.1 Site-specific recombinase XerD [Butyrivibrio sp. ob235]
MGENSAYYNELQSRRRDNINSVKALLPQYAHGFVDECLLKYQINTAYSYAHDIYFFFGYIKENNPLCRNLEIKDIPLMVLEHMKAPDINEFQTYVAQGHKVTKSGIKQARERAIARKMASVRNFFKYLIKFDYLENDPTLKAVTRSREKQRRSINRLDSDQVKMLMDTVTNVKSGSHHSQVMSELTSKRDLAIITLLLNTGIRVSECAGLDLKDVDFKTNTIKIVRKGGFEDELYISEIVRNTLRDYINNERESLMAEDEEEEALFISLKHNRLSVRSIQHMVGKYGQNTGLEKKLTPHKLRRTYGTALYNKTSDIYMVADVLGHKDVNTTVKHYAAVEEEHKRRAAGIDIYDMNDDE